MSRRRRPRRSGALTELPPLRILTQIAVLQAGLYTVATLLLLFTSLVSGRPFSLDLLLGWEAVRGDTTQGWLVAFVWLLAAGLFAGGLGTVLVVRRSKLVLDFALSMHALHLVVVTLYTHALPQNAAWWLTMALSSIVAVALGTWGCRYRELQPITFGGGGASTGNDGRSPARADSSIGQAGGRNSLAGPSSNITAPITGDEEQGFVRGGRRGRGRDGGGEYEMAALKPGEDS